MKRRTKYTKKQYKQSAMGWVIVSTLLFVYSLLEGSIYIFCASMFIILVSWWNLYRYQTK